MAGESRYLPLLLGLGLDELSMSSPRIPAVKSQLRQLDSEACRELARQACECRSAQEIEALLAAFTPEEDVRPLLALENIFVDQDLAIKSRRSIACAATSAWRALNIRLSWKKMSGSGKRLLPPALVLA
ncbi:putative PEP-binding protein [Escherichia coli]